MPRFARFVLYTDPRWFSLGRKSERAPYAGVIFINPCGNFSLTSSVGWHPPLRIVKPQFLASHYY